MHSPMPYFQRKPIDGLLDPVLSPGLPSRVRALAEPIAAASTIIGAPAAVTGIVEQAKAVLASERPSGNAAPLWRSAAADPVASTQRTRISELQEQVNRLVEQFVALTARPPSIASEVPSFANALEQQQYSDTAGMTIQPAPVLTAASPVRRGETAQISISLVNEDERPARIAFISTGLIGDAGERIGPERVSFQPQEVTLQPGDSGKVHVRVDVPVQMSCGVYSGLVRASRLDYLHAVMVVQVE
jgi:hypothetical protein